MKNFNEERSHLNLPAWELRIGIHVGPVVAGVVGKKKYAYDIWGSTVNIASRIESSGLPGMVNVSEATYRLVKDKYRCFYRGKISAKNIGDIDMYFVEKEAGPLPVEPDLSVSLEPMIHTREHPAALPEH